MSLLEAMIITGLGVYAAALLIVIGLCRATARGDR